MFWGDHSVGWREVVKIEERNNVILTTPFVDNLWSTSTHDADARSL